MTPLALVGWVVFGIPSMVAVTFAASRLLGAKRGWWSLLFAGLLEARASLIEPLLAPSSGRVPISANILAASGVQ